MNIKNLRGIIIALIFILSQNISAYANINSSYFRTSVNDVVMVGLKENATLYIGAELELRAFVNEDADIKDVEWLTNKDNIVILDSNGNNATIKAINEGEVSIMARAIDGSDSSRSINVQVREYNKEDNNIKLPQGIVPVKTYGIINKVFQVEPSRNLSEEEKINSIEEYLKIFSLKGNLKLSNKDDYSYYNYTIYEVMIENEPNIRTEIRIDKRDTNLSDKIDDTINNLDDIYKSPPLTPGMIYIKGDGKEDNPYTVEANRNLTSIEKIEAIKEYICEIYKWGNLNIVEIKDFERYTNYKIRISRILNKSKDKNDFYIEIRVDKEDSDSYLPIITMLNKINKKEENPTLDNSINHEKGDDDSIIKNEDINDMNSVNNKNINNENKKLESKESTKSIENNIKIESVDKEEHKSKIKNSDNNEIVDNNYKEIITGLAGMGTVVITTVLLKRKYK